MTDIVTHPTAIEVVEDLFAALTEGDTARAAAHLGDKIVWHNVGLPKVRGIVRVQKAIALLGKPGFGFDAVIHNIAVSATAGNVVLTERTDVLIWRRLRVEFWVCGTFELSDGKIAVWRDYFDVADFLKGLVRGAFRAVVR